MAGLLSYYNTMTIPKFHELSKSQMNAVRGGTSYVCHAMINGKLVPMPAIDADSPEEAADMIHAATGASQVNCTEE